MTDLPERLQEARTWRSYYDAYREAYASLIQERWALGRASFVEQLHHIAVPDVSGVTCGAVNWVAYSQPSWETFEAALSLMGDLLTKEPHRIRSSRYLFVMPEAVPDLGPLVSAGLRPHGEAVDFWADSFSGALAVPLALGPLDSINALAARHSPIIPRDALVAHKWAARAEALAQWRDHAVGHGLHQASVLPRRLWTAILDSAFVLTAFRLDIPPSSLKAVVGSGLGLGAQVAGDRAATSGWGQEAVAYCRRIVEQYPPETLSYRVQPGDILSRIVREKYQMPFERIWPLIRVLNPEILDPNVIIAGQELRLPML